MTKKNMGLAKSKTIRIHPNDLTELRLIQKIFKMSARHKDGDVIHQLIKVFSNNEYKELYDDLVQTNTVLKRTIDLLCEKHNERFADAMELVKCRI